MTFEKLGSRGLDYLHCRYGASRVLFRGPRRRLDRPYAAFLGGTETYGRFLETPFPALAEAGSGLTCVNLGCVNAGLDVYLGEPGLIEIAAGARVTVLQAVGAQNVSNRFYTVHPRRNDRFLAASRQLRSLYPEVDFTEVNFTRHLLTRLRDTSPERFVRVRAELQQAWLGRMRLVLRRIGGPVILLWLSARRPEDPCGDLSAAADPLFVDRPMLEALRPEVAGLVELVATPDEIAAGREDLCATEIERPAAEEMLGARVHQRAAAALAPHLAV